MTLGSYSIDRTSPVPFYFQLRKLLEEQIVSGRWAPGERLPAESAICKQFALSRTTVRQALAELESEGLVRKEKGRGTFIAEPRSSAWLLQSAHGFHEEGARAGHSITSRVLRQELAVLPQWAADALGLPGGSDGVTLERLRWVDARLVMYVVNHLPPDLADTVLSADLEEGSLYQVLEERQGLAVFGGRRVVEAVPAEGELAVLLEIDAGAPILFVESVSWNAQLRPFECYRAWHRADRTKIQVQVVHEDVATRAGFSPTTMTIGGA
jgi:GntR family transcriptional regulator, N-acetylglucosamine utilization regulator